MRMILAIFLVLSTATVAFSDTITDSTCRIAVHQVVDSVFGTVYDMGEGGIRALIEKGYTPYPASSADGLFLSWGYNYNNLRWGSHQFITSGRILRAGNILASEDSQSRNVDIVGVIKKLPRCEIKKK